MKKCKNITVNLISRSLIKTKRFQEGSLLVNFLILLFISSFHMVQILECLKKQNPLIYNQKQKP